MSAGARTADASRCSYSSPSTSSTADLIAAGYAPEAARLDYPGHIVVTDTLGREWAANLPATW